jgi:hypothetical protein
MSKIKILFLAANPNSTSQLSLDEEIRAISAKIRTSEFRDKLHIQSVWAVRPDDLLLSLNEYRPHIVHFSGHGSDKGEIILLDDNKKPLPITNEAIRALFSTLKDNIRIVVLNSCFSKLQAKSISESNPSVTG